MHHDYQYILYQQDNGTARITLNRPQVRNALNRDLIREYIHALGEADRDPEVRVIIVTGAGTAFSAGIDLVAFHVEGALEHREWMELFYWEMTRTVRDLSKPIIASLNGPARAAGCTIAFSCDMIIAAERASIGYPEITRGIPPGIHIWHAPRLIGRMKAAQMLLTGEAITAVEAERIGLITRVVPDDKLEEETRALALSITRWSPLTLKLTRELMYRVESMDFRDAVRTIGDTVCLAFESEDRKEGMKAFAEKRAPEWKGR